MTLDWTDFNPIYQKSDISIWRFIYLCILYLKI